MALVSAVLAQDNAEPPAAMPSDNTITARRPVARKDNRLQSVPDAVQRSGGFARVLVTRNGLYRTGMAHGVQHPTAIPRLALQRNALYIVQVDEPCPVHDIEPHR